MNICKKVFQIYLYLTYSCYPKFDGSIYVYDPLANQTEKDTEDLSKELKMKVGVFI